ncbi:MAG TPA: hypothetical protein DCE42_04055 [Myxococcales bacterium]|nr:hypothetical protein [Deltaproteobacteria bacterium]HAA53900.1 hypothetical protein [Myxococcales bacterium]
MRGAAGWWVLHETHRQRGHPTKQTDALTPRIWGRRCIPSLHIENFEKMITRSDVLTGKPIAQTKTIHKPLVSTPS